MTPRVTAFDLNRRGPRLGFVEVEIGPGVRIAQIAVNRSHAGREWVNLPALKRPDDSTGELVVHPILIFDSPDEQATFEAAILDSAGRYLSEVGGGKLGWR